MATDKISPTIIPVASTSSHAELSGVSVGLRIPPIWRDKIRAWFAHFEAIVSAQKKGDQAMYELVLGQLERQDVDEIYDMLLRPPETNKYQAIKQRLLDVYEESEQQNVQRVLSGLQLGDLKPSQLLRRMQNLSGDHLSEATIRAKWLTQLPGNISSVLALSSSASLKEVAQMADRMMEQQSHHEISAVHFKNHQPAVNHYPQETFTVTEPFLHTPTAAKHRTLEDKIDKLTDAITYLVNVSADNRRGRSPQRNWRGPRGLRGRRDSMSRTRSQSQRRGRLSHRSATPSNSPYCYYHQKFGSEAFKCAQPCTFMQQPSTSMAGN